MICLFVTQSKFEEHHIFSATFQLLSSINISDFNWIQSLFLKRLNWCFLLCLLFRFGLFKHLKMSGNSKIANTLVSSSSLLEDFLQAHFFSFILRTLQLMKSILATLSHLFAPRNYNGAMNCLHSHFNISTHATLCVT